MGSEANVPAIPTYILTPDRMVLTPYRVKSLAEAVAYEPPGVYTVARTFHGDHALLLDAHLDRLEESTRLVGISLVLDRVRLRGALRELLHVANYPDAKFRITVPHDPSAHLYLALEPYVPVSPEVQQHGAHLKTIPMVRHNPVAKTTQWMVSRRPAQQELPPGCYEGLLVGDDGSLLEGLSSNFYGILDGVLHTAGAGVLEGITRRAVFAIAEDLISLRLEPVLLAEVPHLEEAMLTSSGRGVVPVTMIDDQIIGDGRVGPITAEIRQRYESWTEAHLEPI